MDKDEYADIEDAAGNVIGQFNLTTERVVAPNAVVDKAIDNGEPIYVRKNGIASIMTVKRDKKGRPI